MPYRPPLYGIYLEHIFCANVGGGGGQNYFQIERERASWSGKEKAHKHKQIFPGACPGGGGGPPDRVGGGSPDRWPGVKSLCAVCGTQGT